jgi:hypothetical protein
MIDEEKFRATGVWLVLNVYAPLAIDLLLGLDIFSVRGSQFICAGLAASIMILNISAAIKYRKYRILFYIAIAVNFFAYLFLTGIFFVDSLFVWVFFIKEYLGYH